MQGLADFALHAAGGKVEGHSRLAYVPSQDTWSLWRRTSAALLPGAGGLVHPEADKVRTREARLAVLLHAACYLNAQLRVRLLGQTCWRFCIPAFPPLLVQGLC